MLADHHKTRLTDQNIAKDKVSHAITPVHFLNSFKFNFTIFIIFIVILTHRDHIQVKSMITILRGGFKSPCHGDRMLRGGGGSSLFH